MSFLTLNCLNALVRIDFIIELEHFSREELPFRDNTFKRGIVEREYVMLLILEKPLLIVIRMNRVLPLKAINPR